MKLIRVFCTQEAIKQFITPVWKSEDAYPYWLDPTDSAEVGDVFVLESNEIDSSPATSTLYYFIIERVQNGYVYLNPVYRSRKLNGVS